MIFSVLVYGSQVSGQAEQSALRFVQAALKNQHKVHRVFFYGDSVTLASDLKVVPRDETNSTQQWRTLAQEHHIDLVVCIAAAVKRGILNEQEAKRHTKAAANLSSGFELSGLGQLADAMLVSDRLVTFGD